MFDEVDDDARLSGMFFEFTESDALAEIEEARRKVDQFGALIVKPNKTEDEWQTLIDARLAKQYKDWSRGGYMTEVLASNFDSLQRKAQKTPAQLVRERN